MAEILSTAGLLDFSVDVDFSLDQRQKQWRKLILAAHLGSSTATSIINAIFPITSPEPALLGEYADDLLSRWRAEGLRLARVSKHYHVAVCMSRGDFSIHCHSADEEGVPALPGPVMARGQNIRRPVR